MSHASPLIQEDILSYLDQHENKELLRFITCGSVDDGKSTLIGRLLHDSKMIFEDQLAAITEDSKKSGTIGDKVDLALLVDGLQSEREQGITIDVAYRYFSTDKRKFIIADTPGHEQYTRNMATGASTSDLAIILIDARYGVQTQTRRHSFICSLLGIKHVIVAVNKMDLVNYSQDVYKSIQADYLKLAGTLDIPDIRFVPISALDGDNVVNPSENMKWFRGSPLMHYLEITEIAHDINLEDFRFPVQYVNRPNLNFRGYAGTIASGSIRVGDTVRALPSGKLNTIKSIVTFEGELEEATAPMAVTITLNDEIDISRGDMIVKKDNLPHVSSRLRAKVVWMHEEPMAERKEYYIKFNSKLTTGEFDKIHHRIDVNTMAEHPAAQLGLNEIGLVDLHLHEPVIYDSYKFIDTTGSFIVIDKFTNNTVGAGMVEQPLVDDAQERKVSHAGMIEKLANRLVRKLYPHWNTKDVTKQ